MKQNIEKYKRRNSNYIVLDPAQYTHLISFTPPANKPGELHRINVLVIEVA